MEENQSQRDMIPENWQDDSLYVKSLDEVEIPSEPSSDMEGVTDGSTSTDLVEVEDTTEATVTYEGDDTYETYETEPAFVSEFVPVKAYHLNEDGEFVIDEE